MKKKLHEIERMHPLERRKFLKGMAAVLGAMGADHALRFACDEVGGGVAYAQGTQAALGTYFIEIDLRELLDAVGPRGQEAHDPEPAGVGQGLEEAQQRVDFGVHGTSRGPRMFRSTSNQTRCHRHVTTRRPGANSLPGGHYRALLPREQSSSA